MVEEELPIDVDEHFRDCFGIIDPNDIAPHEVVLSFNSFQGEYLKSLSLHSSQQVLVDNEQEV